jgi:hypothetical protein
MKKKVIYRLSFVLSLLIIVLLVWNGCSKRAELSALREQLSKFNIGEQAYIEQVNEQGNKIAEQEQIILSQKDAIQNNLLVIKDLKDVQSQVRIRNIIKIDSILVPYTDTLYLHDSIPFIPRKFNLSNEFYSFNGKTQRNSVLLDSVSFTSGLDITIGSKKMGWFKSPKPIVEVEYTNPYISTTSINNVIIKDEPKWYEKNGLWFGVGIGVGIVGGILINK